MVQSSWFGKMTVLRQIPPIEVAVLSELDEEQVSQGLEESKKVTVIIQRELQFTRPFQNQPWQYTAHAFEYLVPDSTGQDLLPIRSIDTVLKHTCLKIALDWLPVVNYLRDGTHRVLLHFFARIQVADRIEPAHFNATYRILEGQLAQIQGYPIIVGLNVGNEGLLLQCLKINVKTEQDTSYLDILEPDVFQTGPQLASVQPALVPLFALGLGLAKLIAKRHNNVAAQDFALRLDFNIPTMHECLTEGNYLSVQVPGSFQRIWDHWHYYRSSSRMFMSQIISVSSPITTLSLALLATRVPGRLMGGTQ